MSSAILPHGLERASAALHHNHEGTFLHYKAAYHFGKLSPRRGFPSIIAFDVRQFQYVKQLSYGSGTHKPVCREFNPKLWDGRSRYGLQVAGFLRPFFGSSYSPELEEPTKTITIIEETN